MKEKFRYKEKCTGKFEISIKFKNGRSKPTENFKRLSVFISYSR